MPSFTPNYNLIKPNVNNPVDEDLWGGYLNDDLDKIDTLLKAQQDAVYGKEAGPVASGSTVNLTPATIGGNFVHITGTTTINAITLPQGQRVKVIFDDALQLTNSASLINLSGANIITIAGDVAEFIGEGASVTRMTSYERASGRALIEPPSVTPQSAPDAIFTHSLSAGSSGGTATALSWLQRPLNTTTYNNLSGASLGSNQVTLPAGTYYIEMRGSFYRTSQTKMRFRNITDASTAGVSLVDRADLGTFGGCICTGFAYFTISAPKVFELQYYCESTFATQGLGTSATISGNGENEMFAMVSVRKIA